MIGSSSLFILSFQVFTLYCTLSLYSLFTFSQRFSLWVTLSLRFLPATCLPLVGSYTELKIWLFSAGRISLCLKTCYSFILNHSHEKEMCNFNLLSTALVICCHKLQKLLAHLVIFHCFTDPKTSSILCRHNHLAGKWVRQKRLQSFGQPVPPMRIWLITAEKCWNITQGSINYYQYSMQIGYSQQTKHMFWTSYSHVYAKYTFNI